MQRLVAKKRVSGYLNSTKIADVSPKVAYHNLVTHSSTIFRSSVEFQEKPRQILFGGLLTAVLICVAYLNSNRVDDISAVTRGTVYGLLITLVVYCMLQLKDGLMVCLRQ